MTTRNSIITTRMLRLAQDDDVGETDQCRAIRFVQRHFGKRARLGDVLDRLEIMQLRYFGRQYWDDVSFVLCALSRFTGVEYYRTSPSNWRRVVWRSGNVQDSIQQKYGGAFARRHRTKGWV